jgi:hypothetical protein
VFAVFIFTCAASGSGVSVREILFDKFRSPHLS